MRIQRSILLVLATILLVSCNDKSIFDQYKSVGNNWHKDSIVSFKLPKLEANKKYNLFVNIRDNADYQYSNLFLIVSLEHPNHTIKVDTLEFEMATPEGELLGNGFSDVKQSKLVYKQKERFTQRGNYKVKIQQATRQTGKIVGETHLKGITEVGFRIESLD
jgi:gliding motility-associated lipoprotein GldH